MQNHANTADTTASSVQKRYHFSAKWTYNYFEVVTGDDSISILDPFDSGSWWSWNFTLKDDVHGLMGINVGRPLDKLWRNCGNQVRKRSQGSLKNKILHLLSEFSGIDKKKANRRWLKQICRSHLFLMKFSNQSVKTNQAHQFQHSGLCQEMNKTKLCHASPSTAKLPVKRGWKEQQTPSFNNNLSNYLLHHSHNCDLFSRWQH